MEFLKKVSGNNGSLIRYIQGSPPEHSVHIEV